ncbi:MAG: ubiquinol-cytochrome C chaperone [Geminicoccaceae bacterium]|nr:MAG: ubiquinol-cytochrome C chaperone [Geminicoccaceae bacterium]
MTQQGKNLLGGGRARRTAMRQAEILYARAVAQSRLPTLYTVHGIPDTHDGRLEAIQLHVILLLRRLQRGAPEQQAVGQALFDVLFRDVDNSLREGGVGDLSVGKWIKKIARQFYARAAAVEAALETRDRATLGEVLTDNVYAGNVAPERVAGLVDYLLDLDAQLATAATGAATGNDPVEALHFPGPTARQPGSIAVTAPATGSTAIQTTPRGGRVPGAPNEGRAP